MEYCMIVFENTHSAMEAQQALRGSVEFVVMPTLREISASCGISLRVKWTDLEQVRDLLSQKLETQWYKFYHYISQNGEHIVEAIL